MPRPRSRKSAARRYPTPIVDLLEVRQLLSATPAAISSPLANLVVIPSPSGPQSAGVGLVQPAFAPDGRSYGPTQLQTAYGVNLLGAANQGQGVTVAIVDELDDSSAISDVNAYSAFYGLPQFNAAGGPTMQVLLDNHLDTVASAAGTGIAFETSLDLDMAHAMAPKANIILVEVPATGDLANLFKELLEGVQFAAEQPGVVGVSLSYGNPEDAIGLANVVSQNATYLATGAATNVIVTVSTGDDSTPQFPATSPNVVAVGATGLYVSSGRGKYGYEQAWGGFPGAGSGGGGASTVFSTPTFQSANGVNIGGARTIPDISMDGDGFTSVSVYDSFDAGPGNNPWTAAGGTSVSAPMTMGVLALAQQDRIAAHLPILNSVTANTAFYGAYNSASYLKDFHDITLGNNSEVDGNGNTVVAGFSAVAGYDEATGIGSPIANTLVPYLSSQTFQAAQAGGRALASLGSGLMADPLQILSLLPPVQPSLTMIAAPAGALDSDPLAGPNAGSLVLPTGQARKTSPLV